MTSNKILAPCDGSQWIPIPLRTWFWVSYVCFLVAGAIALEVALRFSHKNNGISFPYLDDLVRFPNF